MAQQNKKQSALTPALIAAAAGAAAAGYYFYGSKNAGKNRKQAAKWANEMKGEVMRGVRSLSKVDKRAVVSLINSAAASYEKVRSVRQSDIAEAAGELRQNWERLVSESRAGAGKRGKGKRTSRPKKSAPQKRKTKK